MEFLDARRLTGPSLLLDGPAAILDIACTAEEADRLDAVWRTHVEQMHQALDWEACEFSRYDLLGGVSLAFTASIDALYAASEINEWAWAVCDAEFNGAASPDFEETVAALRSSTAEEANGELLAGRGPYRLRADLRWLRRTQPTGPPRHYYSDAGPRGC